MSIKSNTSIVIQHLTSQPNDLFSSLKIHNIQDFIKKINEQLSSKIRNKDNINNAGFAILHLWTFKTPTFALKKYKNVKSILMVILFLLLFF